MRRQIIIEHILKVIDQLPDDKAQEISDFADLVFKHYEENQLANGIKKMTSESEAFLFLHSEEEVYSITDLKEVYNG